MNELFSITNCYQDDKYYYFFRALNRRDMIGIRNGSILDSNGHINKIVTDSTFYNNRDRYNEESELTLEEMVNHVKIDYDKDTNCISLSSDANVCLTYGRSDYEDKYVIIKVPKDELGKTTFNAGKYIYDEILKRVNAYIAEHQSALTDLQKYYIESLKNISTKEQLDNLKKTLPEEYIDKTNEEFQNGLEFIKSKPYEGYSDKENLAKDKLVMLLDILNFEAVRGKTNRFIIQTMGSAFSSRELEYYKEVPKEKILEMPTSLIEIMALIQQMPETEEIKEIKNYLITHLDEIRQNTKEINYNNFRPEDLDFSLDNLYNLTEGKISHKDAKELYLNSMYLVKAKLRAYASIRLLDNILGNNSKFHKTLQNILDNSLGIEPAIMSRYNINRIKVSDTVILNLSRKYQDVYNYINSLKANDLYDLFENQKDTFNILFSKYIKDKSLEKTEKKEWYANGLIDAANLNALNVKIDFSKAQRRIIIDSLIDNNFLDYYDNVKNLSSDSNIATSMLASLVANRKDFTDSSTMSLDQLKTYIGYNTLKEYKLPLRKLQRRGYEKLAENYFYKSFAVSVMPTGSGKSFLALAEMLNHKLEKMLYIAPNVIILSQIEDYIYEFFGYSDYHTLFPNLTLTTYQDLKAKKPNKLKDKYSGKYDFIILDELHRSGAKEWMAFVNELMENQDKEKIKVLGLTATPERDRDDKDMSVYWARYFGYTDDEIELNKQLAINESLESAIKAGLLANPKFINCLYSYRSDGTLDEMYERISMIADEEKKAKAFAKYERLCHQVDQSSGIEKIFGDNLSKDGKYVVFLPVGYKKDGTCYNSEDGSKVSKQQAVQIISDYTILIRQYLYSNEYMKIHGEKLLSIYDKITKKQELSSEDKDFLNREQDNIMLLDMIKIKHKPAALNTFNTTIVSTIARHLGWKKLDKSVLKERIEINTKDMVSTNSLLSYYSNSKNKKELAEFNKETNDKPKLLFVMDKLNEGAHLKGVKGIVWLRPLSVDSRILFYQQLGRCIHSYPDGHIFTEEERPIVMDLVNNINTVNLKRNQLPINDLEDFKRIIIWISDNGGKLPNKNSSILEEKNYGLKLNVILYRYIKYINVPEKLDNIKNKKAIKEILRLGSEIDLWNIKIDEPTREIKEKEAEEKEEKFLQGFLQVESLVQDFVNLKEEIDELASPESTFDKIFNYLSILKNQGIDINSISRDDRLKVIKNNSNYSLQIIKMKTIRENGKQIIINEEEYKEPGLFNIGIYVYAFKKGKAYFGLKSPDLNANQIEQLQKIGFEINLEKNNLLNPRSFEDYFQLLNKLQESKAEYNINNISYFTDLKITKHDNKYEFELIDSRISNEISNNNLESLNHSRLIKIGKILYFLKRGKSTSGFKDLDNYQIEQLISIGLEIKLEKERDYIMDPKSFDDYIFLLKKLKVRTGCDLNNIESDVVIRATKINEDYDFEYFENKEKAKEKYGKNVKTIGIGRVLYWLKRGKSTSGFKNLDDHQIEQLISIGLEIKLENERDPLMEPKSFEDYVFLLRKLQENNIDINKINSSVKLKIFKIDDSYKFELYDNNIEVNNTSDATWKNRKQSKLIAIGGIINRFKRGKNNSQKDLEPEQINKLRYIGLDIVIDRMLNPKSFDDYFLILQEINNKTAYNINDISLSTKLLITKTSDDYKFEFLNDNKQSKNEGTTALGNPNKSKLIRIGSIINCFKRGKNYSNKALEQNQIEKLRSIGLRVILENKKDSILYPKNFEDYILILKQLKNKTNIDINNIFWNAKLQITKINDDYEFELLDDNNKTQSTTAAEKNLNYSRTIIIGGIINRFKRGKDNNAQELDQDQIKQLQEIGLIVVPEKLKETLLVLKSFEDYITLLKEIIEKTDYDINSIKQADCLKVVQTSNNRTFQIISKKNKDDDKGDLIQIGTKISLFRRGKYSTKTNLTIDQMQTLLSIGFKFNKGIEDKIYKQEVCKTFNIDLKINEEIINRTSKQELISKIKFLAGKGIYPVDTSGKLIDIFSMSSLDIEKNYGLSLETIINTYGKGVTKK